MTADIREWLRAPRTFRAKGGEPGLVHAILGDLWNACPGQITSEEPRAIKQLNTIGRACGNDGVVRMVGASICEANGSGSITLELTPFV